MTDCDRLMSSRRRRAWAGGGVLAALVLSAGPGNAQSFQQVSPPSAPWPEPVVYAALTSRGVVNVYRDKDTRPKHPIFTFGLDPGTESSLVVDQKGNLFLADPFSTWVYEYAPGASAPTKSFPTSQTPFNIALFGNTLYVFQSMPSGGGASIAIYGHGSTSPTRSLSNPAIVFPQGMAVDGAGNVFVAYGGATLGKYGVGEFAAGRMPMKRIKIPHSIFPVALGIDPSGNLLVDGAGNQAGQSTLFIFPPGQIVPSGSLAMPSLYQFSFTADGTSMYVGDVGDRSFRKYSYPSGTLIYRKKDQDARWGFSGIAASPAPSVGVW